MRSKSEHTRTRILDAAYESFWRSGFARTSVDAIAARAGLTKRTVYLYFRSKDDLLSAVLARYRELAAIRLDRIGSRMPADRDGLIDSFFGQLAGWAGSALVRLGIHAAGGRAGRSAGSSGTRHCAPGEDDDRNLACAAA